MLLCDKTFLFKIIYNLKYNFSLKQFILEINNLRILYIFQNVTFLYTNLKTKKKCTPIYILHITSRINILKLNKKDFFFNKGTIM